LCDSIDVRGQHVLVRADLNVPFDKTTGAVSDDTRIRGALPTLNYLSERGAKVVLCSHLGRPKGAVHDSMRLAPVAARLEELLGSPVAAAADCIGDDVAAAAQSLSDGGVLLLENLRFHAGEEKNDAEFAKAICDASQASIFVNDAFGTAHRAHASTEGVTHHVEHAVAGFLLEKELKYLKNAVDVPTKPLVAIVGGAKVSTKLPVLESLLAKVDTIVVGGGMVFTFLKAQGMEIGASLLEDEMQEMARDLVVKAEASGVRLLLPRDVVVAESVEPGAPHRVVAADAIPAGWIGLDIGPDALADVADVIGSAKTVIWNGPMGMFEVQPFDKGTMGVASLLAEATTKNGTTTIIGGGDSVAAVEMSGLASSMSHISTGGGASLELLEGKVLPGVAALDTK
jgi:phosphoglycerate kinase